MRAVVCRAFDGIDGLVLDDVAPPALGGGPQGGGAWGDVRIRVRAAGVNFADTLMVRGTYQVTPPLPFTPGLEVAGEVVETAPGSDGPAPGTRVMAIVHHGGFAEEAVAPADNVYPIPDGMDFETAAGFPIAYGTSHHGLAVRAGLKAGETLLVNGAAGGVGLTAVEVGKRLGARVIATAGGPSKLKVAADHGADEGIDYRTESIRDRVKALTDGRGADVVYDPVGGDAFDQSLRATVQGGRILVVGFASGTVPQVPANILLVKNVSLIGYYFGAWRVLDPAGVRASMDELLGWYAAGELKPLVSATWPLDGVREALRALLDRKTTGKVVLVP